MKTTPNEPLQHKSDFPGGKASCKRCRSNTKRSIVVEKKHIMASIKTALLKDRNHFAGYQWAKIEWALTSVEYDIPKTLEI